MIKKYVFALLISMAPLTASAAVFDVLPSQVDLVLAPGDMQVEQLSFTINVLLVSPFEVDVYASDPAALMQNLSGILVNTGGGDTDVFDIKFTGDLVAQSFDLIFFDAEFGGDLASIPVTISLPSAIPVPAAVWLFGSAIIGLIGMRRRLAKA